MSTESQNCDSCSNSFSSEEIERVKSKNGAVLELCPDCAKLEHEALAAQAPEVKPNLLQFTQQGPQKNSGGVDFIEEEHKLSVKIQDFLKHNYMDFFNQEVTEIKELSIEQLKDRILAWSEEYFGKEADAIRVRVKKQAALSTFNARVSKLSESEKAALKEKDKNYAVANKPVKPLADPMKALNQKKKAIKTIEEKGKALGLSDEAMAKLFGD
jgi:uncharacterized protein YbcI